MTPDPIVEVGDLCVNPKISHLDLVINSVMPIEPLDGKVKQD